MEFFVLLFFFGLSAGVIGKIKGGSFLIWFLVGAIVPFAGTLAAVLWRFDRNEPRRGCPECGNVVPLYVQVCTRCGRDLDFPEEPLGQTV